MKKVSSCFNCNGKDLKHYIRVPDRHYGIKGEFDYSICNSCSLVFLDPMPSEEELNKFYPEDNYYSYYMDIFKKESFLKKLIKTLFLLEIKTKDPKFNHPGKILDIGCGNGWTLYDYRLKGWQVYGVEPAKIAAEIGNKANLNIFNGNLLEAKFPDKEFDYIRSNHSFEHIPNPNEVLNEIYRIMKDDGLLLIGVPNIDGINAKIARQYWYFLGAPVHTFNYNTKTLTDILTKNGFSIKKVHYNSNRAGILGSMQIFLNKKTKLTSDKGFVINFLPFKIIGSLIAKIENILNVGDCIEIVATKRKFK